jgi:nucleotide-binding universal stress UspA family protein
MFSNIVVPIDFSEYTDEILEYASEIAGRFNASVHVIHIVPTMDYFTPYESFMAAEYVEAMQRDIESETVKQLDAAAARVKAANVTKAIRTGSAFIEITGYADSVGADLIVMGTHGRGGLEHILLGSVAEKVVRKSSCPVLTIRPGQRQRKGP